MRHYILHGFLLLSAFAQAISNAFTLEQFAERINREAEQERRQTVPLEDSSLDFDFRDLYFTFVVVQGDVCCPLRHLTGEEGSEVVIYLVEVEASLDPRVGHTVKCFLVINSRHGQIPMASSSIFEECFVHQQLVFSPKSGSDAAFLFFFQVVTSV